MRMIAKNERMNGRIDECEKLLAQRDAIGTRATYASMAGKGVSGMSG